MGKVKTGAHVTFVPKGIGCHHCGERYALDGDGTSIGMLQAILKQFTKEHQKCKPSAAGKARFEFTTPDEWAASWDTGISSATIWSVMTGRPSPVGGILAFGSAPSDPADFGRCYRLLKAFPEWRARIHEVGLEYIEWSGLVLAWDELTALYEEELPSGTAPKLYARMKELTDG